MKPAGRDRRLRGRGSGSITPPPLAIALAVVLGCPLVVAAPARGAAPAGGPGVRLAAIGDYGVAGQAEQDVADLVHGWRPDFVITLGDNNYPLGSAETIDANIGAYYGDYIGRCPRRCPAGAAANRFFPALGNHDWYTPGAAAYLAYFSLPGNERYYSIRRRDVQLFALDSDASEPDGITRRSVQARWLRRRLAASDAAWKIVYFHHAPYSSGPHGSQVELQWPFRAWGATAVLAGHDHLYERIMRGGFPYFVNGLGGTPAIYSFGTPVRGSEARFNADHGAMLIEADAARITFQFITRQGELIDRLVIDRAADPRPDRATPGIDRPRSIYLPAVDLCRAREVARRTVTFSLFGSGGA